AMDRVALAPPVHVAGRALAQELAPARRRQRAEMRVRQMREEEHAILVSRASAARPGTQGQESRSAAIYFIRIPLRTLGPGSRSPERHRTRTQRGASSAGTRERGHELPINIPATNTSTPPTTTWKVAARNGVSMYRWRM